MLAPIKIALLLTGAAFAISVGLLAQTPAVRIQKLEIVYPRLAILAGEQGEVEMLVNISPNGEIEQGSIHVISGERAAMLVQAAIESLRKSKFLCDRCDKPVAYHVTYDFVLPPHEAKARECKAKGESGQYAVAPGPVRIDSANHVSIYAPAFECAQTYH